MTVQDVDNAFRKKADASVKLFGLRKKIENGTATMEDAAQYQMMLSKILGQTVGENILKIPESERVKFLDWILRNQYRETNDRLAVIQQFLDKQLGINIAPQKAPFPEERVNQLGRSLTDPTVPESTIQRRARAGTETVTKSFHDAYVKKNASFRSRAGLKCYITRKAVSGCCEWCTAMAGRYEYGEEPDDIYRRHDNCDCTVTFENGRKRQDVWSKREWEAPEPGAGADELVRLEAKPTNATGDLDRLTREQAQKLRTKHQLSYLTGGVRHGILNTEEKQFLDRILADPDMSPEYRQILMDRFSSGSEIAQKAFVKFVPDNSVSNSHYTTNSAFYWKKTKSISMSYERDENHWALNGTTWFHEHGHLIDDFAGQITFNHPEYLAAIRSDFAKLISSRIKSKQSLGFVDAMNLLAKDSNLQMALSAELDFSPAQQAAVSDIMEGISAAMIRGCSGHIDGDPDYWNNGYTISSEAFANMFESQFDEARYRQMQMYFPNALAMFEKLLKEVVI